MQNVHYSFFAFLLCFSILIPGCEQDPGEGGRATITGSVIWRDTYSSPILNIEDSVIAEYPAVEERIYLTYGSEGVYDDDFRTDFDGKYEFKFLRKGVYKLFAYHKCEDCDEGLEPVFVEVEISKNKGDNAAPTIYLINDTSN